MPVNEQSIVAQWNEVNLEAIRQGSALPTTSSYQLHLVSAAVYDAYAAFDPLADGYYSKIDTPLLNTEANKAEAVSFAAYTALSEIYPEQQALFDAFMAELGYDPAAANTDPSTAAGVGTLAAENVFDARVGDGSNAENGYVDTTGYMPVNDPEPGSDGAPGGVDFDPNHWQPLRVPTGTVVNEDGVPIIDPNDPASYSDQVAITPHWGEVTSFGMEDNSMFRPDTPPQLGDFSEYVDGAGNVTTNDQAYRDQVTEVMDISANLTNEHKVMAEFWADGPRTEAPPGHWNQIAQDIALRDNHGLDQDAQMFFALNAAIFDAGIATWEAKYHYDYIRPQSAIRDLYHGQNIEAWGGPNSGTEMMLGEEWQPYQNVTFVTPAFPEYVSGHSTFSMAAAKTLAAFTGTDAFYDGVSYGNYDLDSVEGTDLLGQYVTNELVFEEFGEGEPHVVLQWETLTEAAEEAGISRLYGGIHIQDGNLNGLKVGEEVAAHAEVKWQALFTRGGNDNFATNMEGGLALAGSGDDVVRGRRGDDEILGQSGDDILLGRRGNDTLDGGDGKDWLIGGHHKDLLIGGDDSDFLHGGKGMDTLYGGAGEDILRGGRGPDLMFGGDDDDLLAGGQGDDTINGGDGSDILLGKAGRDVFVFDAEDEGVDFIKDFDETRDSIRLDGFSGMPEIDSAFGAEAELDIGMYSTLRGYMLTVGDRDIVEIKRWFCDRLELEDIVIMTGDDVF
ncbi:DUF6851 domain-containing protein [Sulfitobacter sp. JB4-11]|uniref:DUF6851 domain-containing protein n=1 Tax=Sulfitobacter rhodophyticola TaxID=3238304 RepID=UPI003D8167C7